MRKNELLYPRQRKRQWIARDPELKSFGRSRSRAALIVSLNVPGNFSAANSAALPGSTKASAQKLLLNERQNKSTQSRSSFALVHVTNAS